MPGHPTYLASGPIASLAKQGATVWLQDYNLWLVPALLKADRPDVTIGLFHHTPFPHPDVFRRIPPTDQLRNSLARLDWAGFHTPDFADNFRRLLAGTAVPAPHIGVHPLGIDRRAVAHLARARDTALPHPHDEGPQVVLSVETPRLAKAPVHKIRALDTLLTRWSSSSYAAGPTTRAPTVRPRAGVRLA
ncbi:hypothetical protein OQI_23820 [Streptomyces pharetrae CZA14]|uniref:Trehalose-6-phosphate synthase n=1 Tax=Streptomyces pharetrae CZA14 TaxID=1144883 RepID=A0ABX3YDU5_9ACTN|nr:hypothetical protein OQI_23820 [Streptomyces pharetrae CZA14]